MPTARRTLATITDISAAPSLALARIVRSPDDDQGGFRFWFDGAHVNSWPTNADPSDNDVVGDLTLHADAAWDISGSAPDYAGNGFDFAGNTIPAGPQVIVPASVNANIWGDGVVAQHFGVVLYARLPSSSDWNPRTTVLPLWDGGGQFFADPSLGMIGMVTNGGVKQLEIIRPRTTSARDDALMAVPAGAHGKFCQVAMWRDAGGLHYSLRHDDGADGVLTSVTQVDTGAATNSFAARPMAFGSNSYFNSIGGGGSQIPASAFNWKLFAGGVENLRQSGRNFEAVLADDWAFRLARKNAGDYVV